MKVKTMLPSEVTNKLNILLEEKLSLSGIKKVLQENEKIFVVKMGKLNKNYLQTQNQDKRKEIYFQALQEYQLFKSRLKKLEEQLTN